ncbi:hypothetical protein CFP56_018939 [Quercus suber]|uniref:Uncharacterized protein n=1 Tax=Quercus suber TaxID=58331 RepID=A0AAW0KJ67_QUESU
MDETKAMMITWAGAGSISDRLLIEVAGRFDTMTLMKMNIRSGSNILHEGNKSVVHVPDASSSHSILMLNNKYASDIETAIQDVVTCIPYITHK